MARASAWLVIVLGLYVLLGIVGWTFLRANAGKLAEMASDDVDFGFGELITNSKEEIEITNVRYGDIAKVERIKLKLDYDGYKTPKIRSIELVRPEVLITDELLQGDKDESSDPPDLSWLQIAKVAIRDGKVRVALSGMPEVRAEVDFEGEDIDGASGGALSPEPMRVRLRNVSVAGYGNVAEAEIDVRVPGDLQSVRVERFQIKGASVAIEDLAAGFPVSADVEIEGGVFDVSRDGVVSNDPARVVVTNASIGPHASFDQITVDLIPSEFLENGQIEQVYVKKPVLRVDASLMKKIEAMKSGEDSDLPDGTIYRVMDFVIEEGMAVADLGKWMPGLPHARTEFSLRTEKREHTPAYVLDLTNVEFRSEESAKDLLGRGKRLTVIATPGGLQQDSIIDSVEMFGFDATIGKAVDELVTKLGASEETADTPDTADSSQEWRIARMSINKSRVIIQDIIPGLPSLPFQLDGIELNKVPLSGRDRGDENLQRVELANLDVASALNPLINVATLRSIWVEFTVPGIFRSELEKIEIVGPEIFIGEHLFWYIDFYRNFDTETGSKREEITEVAPLAEVVEAANPEEKKSGDEGAIDALEDAFAAVKLSGWTIKKIAASSGKITVAPHGTPIGIFPFPFSFESDLEKRKIDFSLEVAQGDYTFENIKVELKQLKGKSFFNYPIRAKDNNFVQTFTAEAMHYEQLMAKDVALSITYDRKGIYGQIWASAYGGDMNAEFNIYIDGENYKWDAWATAVGFQLGPFTEVLVPDSLRMSGRIDGKIVTNGVEFDVEKAVGDIKAGEGTMHITKFDEVIADFPDDLSEIQKMLMQTGLDIFRNYRFRQGQANLDLTGRDGTAKILFEGDDGKRELNFRFIDKLDATP